MMFNKIEEQEKIENVEYFLVSQGSINEEFIRS